MSAPAMTAATERVTRCRIPDCGRAIEARQLCPRHYRRMLRHGTTDLIVRSLPGSSSTDVIEHFEGRLTYRMLDYWVRTGKIAPSLLDGSGSGGYGRRWSESDVAALDRILRTIETYNEWEHRFETGELWAELAR